MCCATDAMLVASCPRGVQARENWNREEHSAGIWYTCTHHTHTHTSARTRVQTLSLELPLFLSLTLSLSHSTKLEWNISDKKLDIFRKLKEGKSIKRHEIPTLVGKFVHIIWGKSIKRHAFQTLWGEIHLSVLTLALPRRCSVYLSRSRAAIRWRRWVGFRQCFPLFINEPYSHRLLFRREPTFDRNCLSLLAHYKWRKASYEYWSTDE